MDLEPLRKFIEESDEGTHPKTPFHILSRITIQLSDTKGASVFSATNYGAYLGHYDIVAVEPTCLTTLQSAVSNLNIDLVTLNLADRLPFRLKPKLFTNALQRGIHVEATYDGMLSSGSSRRHTLSNLRELVRCLKSKNLILSSGADAPWKIRRPADVCTLGSLWGLNTSLTKQCLTTYGRSCVLKGENRRSWAKSGVQVIDSAPQISKRPLDSPSDDSTDKKKTK